MMKKYSFFNLRIFLVSIALCCLHWPNVEAHQNIAPLPDNFVYLENIEPSIVQDIRYAKFHNFIGHPIRGYHAEKCILTEQAAKALAQVQAELMLSRLSLKVFDCYRPTMAVDEFFTWSLLPQQQEMKAEFYPNVDKKDFFKLGYVAEKSGHSRGSTVDLAIVPLGGHSDTYVPQQALQSCTQPYQLRFFDGMLDFGTGYDCMDPLSHGNAKVGLVARANRAMLRDIMDKYGFDPYPEEWWHFTLRNEPFPKTYFNFPIR